MAQTVVLDKELGEVLCDRCNGEGKIYEEKYAVRCPKCLGNKKLDWCERITGVAPKIIGADFEMFLDNLYLDSCKYPDLQQKVYDDMANAMAMQIDKDILDTLEANLEHNTNNQTIYKGDNL